MHIVELPSFFTPYGGEFCLEQAKALQSLGHEVRIISNVQLSLRISGWRYFCYPLSTYWHEADGISVYQHFMHGFPKVIRPNVRRWVAGVQTMFAAYVRQYGKPDVIHAHCGKWAGYAAMLLSDAYHVPYVITEHLPKEIFMQEFERRSSREWAIPMIQRAYQQAGAVITVSDELPDELSGYFPNSYRHVFIPNVVDVDFYACRARRPVEGRSFCFCCLAIFDERKGYDVLFEAFDQLVRIRSDVRLVIAGRGTDSAACKKMLAGYSCAQQVSCLDELDKEGVRSCLYESDALVLATRGESQGLVLLEALSTGIPVISTEAIPMSVRPSEGAVFVPVNDAETLMKAMLAMMEKDSVKPQELSEMVARMASPATIGRKLESVLAAVVGNGK